MSPPLTDNDALQEQLASAQRRLAELESSFEERLQARTEALTRQRDDLQDKLQRLYSETEYHRLFIEVLDDVISLHDLQGNYLYVSPSVVRQSGYTPDELITHNDLKLLIPEEDLERVLYPVLECSARGESVDVEWRFRRKDGNYIWLSTHTKVLCDTTGVPALILCFSRDITARKQAELELETAQVLIKSLIDHSPTAITVTDIEGRYILVNRFTATALGLPGPEVMLGKLIDDFLGEAIGERSRASFRHVYQSGETITDEFVVKFADGTHTSLTLIFPIADHTGHIFAFGSISTDVTSYKQLEQELRASEQRFRSVWEATSDAMVMADVEGIVEMANQAYFQLYGFSPAEVIGKPFNLIYPEDERERAMAFFRQLFQASVSMPPREIAMRRRDGAALFVEARTDFITTHDKRLLLGSIRDITARKQAEQERLVYERRLQEAQRLESIAVLAGGVAHDFNNILVAIMGYTELALPAVAHDVETYSHLHAVITSAKRAADLTNQLLAFAGKGRFLVQPTGLNELVSDLELVIRASVPAQISLDFRLADNLPQIAADRSQLRQMLLNLITNAAEAIGEHAGLITITTATARLEAAALDRLPFYEDLQPGLYVRLEVSDSGEGIAEEAMARIFEPFFSTRFTGRGLGLPAVRGIVRGHRGTFEVHSTPGQGTRFIVWLPAVEAVPALERRPAPAVVPAHNRGGVLLIDDEDGVRLVASRMLERLGYTVHSAADGPAGLALLRGGIAQLHVALIDLTMPVMSGDAVARSIRQILPELPIILMSGYSAQEVSERFADIALLSFVQKPFNLAGLEEVLESVVRNQPS